MQATPATSQLVPARALRLPPWPVERSYLGAPYSNSTLNRSLDSGAPHCTRHQVATACFEALELEIYRLSKDACNTYQKGHRMGRASEMD